VRNRLLRLGKAARDGFAHVRKLHRLVRNLGIERCRRRRCSDLGCGRSDGRFSAIEVRLHDTSAGAAALNVAKVDALGLGDTARKRARLHAIFRIRRHRGGRRRLRRFSLHRFGCWLRLLFGLGGLRRLFRFRFCSLRRGDLFALFREHGNELADRNVLRSRGNDDLRHNTLVDGFNLHRRLVGFDLGDDVARRDLVAFLHQPFRERPHRHRGRQRGHCNVNRHVQSL